mgnify:FL=1
MKTEIKIKLKLEEYRGKYYARGEDAFGIPVRSSLKISLSEGDSVALKALGKLESSIQSNGGHAFVKGTELIVDDLLQVYYDKGIKKEEVSRLGHVARYWAQKKVSAIDEAAVLKWERSMIARGLCPSTIKRYNTSFKAAINYGCKSKNLTAPVIPSLGQDSPARKLHIQNEDRDQIIARMDNWEARYFTVLAWSGARPSELINLRWKDVDRKGKTFTIGSYKGKNGQKKARTIPLASAVEEVFDELSTLSKCRREEYVFKANCPEWRNKKEKGPESIRSWASFSDPTGAVRYRLEKATEAAGYEFGLSGGITLYAFRHTFGTNAGNNGSCNPMMLSQFMGHSKVQTTTDNYFHGGVKDAESLVEGLS